MAWTSRFGGLSVPKYLLLTGATGLVGQYLVRDLLLDGHRLALIVRSSKKENVYERVEGLLQKWESELTMQLPRPVVFEGDVAEPGLGLDEEARSWIGSHCDRILHNAAVLTFVGADRAEEPWRTNLTGTKHVLGFCQAVGLEEMHYVSTAYVCGEREGTILESELECNQTFRNDYENAKYQAEKLVREAKFLRKLTVYRPAVIAGDSLTGYTSTYHGLYMYLQMISVINRYTDPDPDGRRHTPIRMAMTGDEPRNVVPVDWVSQVICRLVSNPAAVGQTFHLAPKVRMTPRDILMAGYRFFNSYGVEFTGPPKKATDGTVLDETINPAERAVYESKTIYEAYETSDPLFDTSNLDRLLPDLPPPEIDIDMLCRFWKFGEEDKWGRRRLPAVKVDSWARSLLANVSAEDLARRLASELGTDTLLPMIGLAVEGAGGGEWKLLQSADGEWQLEPGLPSNEANSVLTLNMDRLKALTQSVSARECAEVEGAIAPEAAHSL